MSIFSNTQAVNTNILIAFAWLFLIFGRCTESNINISCSDPIGSDYVELEDGQNFCFMESLSGCFQMRWGESSIEIISITFTDGITGQIVDVGVVDCLGEVVNKPETGYMDTVTIEENHGYVVKFPNDTYGRIYIDSFTESAFSNEVVSVRAVRQYTF